MCSLLLFDSNPLNYFVLHLIYLAHPLFLEYFDLYSVYFAFFPLLLLPDDSGGDLINIIKMLVAVAVAVAAVIRPPLFLII